MQRFIILLCLAAVACGTIAAQGIDLGPPPVLPPPDDGLGELFDVEPSPDAADASVKPDLSPFPEPESSLGEWESLEPPEPEFPDGMIIYQGPVTAEPPDDRAGTIESHDGRRDYSSQDATQMPGWVLAAAAIAVLLVAGVAVLLWRREQSASGGNR